MISEALSVADKHTAQMLTDTYAFPEIHFQEYEFRKEASESILTSEQSINLEEIFNLRSLALSDVAILKVTFLPHDKGPTVARAVYAWNDLFENLLEMDVETFFHFCQEEWIKLTKNTGHKTFHPLLWRMFTADSYEKVINFNLQLWFGKSLEHFDQLDVLSVNSKITTCAAYWQATTYPITGLPETLTVAFRPVSTVYNPFEMVFQNPFNSPKTTPSSTTTL